MSVIPGIRRTAGNASVCYERTEVGVIPNDWDVRTIGTVAEIHNGATPSTQHPAYWNGNIPWCTPTDITRQRSKYLSTTERTITEIGLRNCGARLLPAGSLLLCSRATIGAVKIATVPLCTNQGFKSVVSGGEADNEFLYYLILSLEPTLLEKATGSTFLEVSKHDLAQIPVALPPLPEQRVISGALADVDALLESLEKLIAKKWAIRQATMQKLLTGRTRLPKFYANWEWVEIRKFARTYGGLSGKTKSDFRHGNAPYVSFLDVLENVTLNCRQFRHVRIASTESQNQIRIGDVLFNATSETPEDLGMGSMVAVDLPDLYLNSFCFGIRIVDRGRCDPLFLAYLSRGEPGRTAMYSLAQGATRYNLSKGRFLALQICLPPLPEQIAIAAVLADIDAEIDALEQRRDKTRAIKQGMMQQLLTGRIRLPLTDPELQDGGSHAA